MKYQVWLKILIFVLSRNLNETIKNHHSFTAYQKKPGKIRGFSKQLVLLKF